MGNRKRDLFLDHDGTLTYISKGDSGNVVEIYKNGVENFLRFLVDNYNVYWCSGWSLDDLNGFMKKLSINSEVISSIRYFNYNFHIGKARSIIKYTKDFLLIDDDPNGEEIKILNVNRLEKNFVKANPKKADDLRRIINYLKRIGIE